VTRADTDGHLWFCGCQKQIIIHDSSNVCPQEVEAALIEHAAVASAGVVGVQSPCTAKACGPMSCRSRPFSSDARDGFPEGRLSDDHVRIRLS
jgi:acyl-CoA synthetase (AMP-forming)/AMP-acid ligase II